MLIIKQNRAILDCFFFIYFPSIIKVFKIEIKIKILFLILKNKEAIRIRKSKMMLTSSAVVKMTTKQVAVFPKSMTVATRQITPKTQIQTRVASLTKTC